MFNKMLGLFLTIILTCSFQINGSDDGLRLPFKVKMFATRPPVIPPHKIKPADRWKLGIVPYLIDVHRFDYILTDKIRDAMGVLEQETCLKFQPLIAPLNNGSWFLNITVPDDKSRECVHDIDDGDEGATHLRIGYDCLKQPQLLHSLMHAVGMQDEVNHPQRDKYIRIMWENIKPKYRALFRIKRDIGTQGLYEYDPSSVTHFHDRAFSRNGQATIVPMMAGLQIRPSGELSLLDKQKLQGMYADECNKRKVVKLMHSCKHAMKGQASNVANQACGNQDVQNPISQKLFWAKLSAQDPFWINHTDQNPFWANMSSHNPFLANINAPNSLWKNMTSNNPIWANMTSNNPIWANQTFKNLFWANQTLKNPIWANQTLKNPIWANMTSDWANQTFNNPIWANMSLNQNAQNDELSSKEVGLANKTRLSSGWANITSNNVGWANITSQNDELSSKEVDWANITATNITKLWRNMTRLRLGNNELGSNDKGNWGILPRRTNEQRRKNIKRKLKRY